MTKVGRVTIDGFIRVDPMKDIEGGNGVVLSEFYIVSTRLSATFKFQIKFHISAERLRCHKK